VPDKELLNKNIYSPIYLANNSDSCAEYAVFCTVNLDGGDGRIMEKVDVSVSFSLFSRGALTSDIRSHDILVNLLNIRAVLNWYRSGNYVKVSH